MATLKDLTTIIEPMSVDELTNLFAQSTAIVGIQAQQKKLAQLIADRDAATSAAGEEIANAQAELNAMQMAVLQPASEVIPIKNLG